MHGFLDGGFNKSLVGEIPFGLCRHWFFAPISQRDTPQTSTHRDLRPKLDLVRHLVADSWSISGAGKLYVPDLELLCLWLCS